uniref:Reverse transcriptase domain-containing protein n=3 Tax=Nothobranchius TaxID=28779 RepID=A0A1A8LS20_9TELE
MYSGGDLKAAWKGIKCMASCNHQKEDKKPINVKGVPDSVLPDVFNSFFSRFERGDLVGKVGVCKEALKPSEGFVISLDQVTILLKKVKVGKARGPDAICGRTLHHCANQLSGVFSRLFQTCVDVGQIPSLWKTSTIIPIPKSSTSKELSDFRPVALTSLVMKTFEKILKSEILSLTEGRLDPLQFAYQQNKGVEDAVLCVLNMVYRHLDKTGTCVRLLFADFSSAFNKMQPHILIERLANVFNLPDQLLLLILNFLTGRTQRVLVNGQISLPLMSSTGSPQGCVLSPLLFILYTDSCRVTQNNRFLVKFSDDTVLMSLLSGSEINHGPALSDFVEWCDSNYLDLNVKKTKDMIIDFRRSAPPHLGSSIIHGEVVEVVEEYRYLGSWIDNKLRFVTNTDSIFKRAQQRIYLLRKLNYFNVNKRILCNFYSCFIESILTFSFVCWYKALSMKDKKKLQSIVKTCSKIIGAKQRDLQSLWEERVRKKAKSILGQPLHALHSEFSLMPSGRRYYVPSRKTNRFANSFVPSAIELLNSEPGRVAQ